jgi:hypothetical protein
MGENADRPHLLTLGSDDLVVPQPLEPIRRKLGIAHRVVDIFVSEVMLDRPSVVTVVRELVSARMAKHVWVRWEGESGQPAGTGHYVVDVGRRHRPGSLSHENTRRLAVVAAKPTQRTSLFPAERMIRRSAILRTDDTQHAFFEINLIPVRRGFPATTDIALIRVVQLALVTDREHANEIKVRKEPVEGDIATLAERNYQLANLSLDATADERVRRERGHGRLDGRGGV